jgi:hypothetical protein
MRRLATISVLFASGGLISGCGSSGHATSTVRASSATTAKTATSGGASRSGSTPAPRSSTASLRARAQARAFADAVNLRASDIPGFRRSSLDEHASGEKRAEKELLRCVGSVGASRGLVESGSGDFQHQASIISLSVSSEVSVAQTPALADKQLAAFRSGSVPKCLSHYFSSLLSGQRYQGAKVSPVSTKQGSPPAPGTTGSFGLRFTATVTLHRIPIPLYIDILGFVKGSAEVSLFATGLPEPVPAHIEEHLFMLLLARAKRHAA